jgi:hypothetical protein
MKEHGTRLIELVDPTDSLDVSEKIESSCSCRERTMFYGRLARSLVIFRRCLWQTVMVLEDTIKYAVNTGAGLVWTI